MRPGLGNFDSATFPTSRAPFEGEICVAVFTDAILRFIPGGEGIWQKAWRRVPATRVFLPTSCGGLEGGADFLIAIDRRRRLSCRRRVGRGLAITPEAACSESPLRAPRNLRRIGKRTSGASIAGRGQSLQESQLADRDLGCGTFGEFRIVAQRLPDIFRRPLFA